MVEASEKAREDLAIGDRGQESGGDVGDEEAGSNSIPRDLRAGASAIRGLGFSFLPTGPGSRWHETEPVRAVDVFFRRAAKRSRQQQKRPRSRAKRARREQEETERFKSGEKLHPSQHVRFGEDGGVIVVVAQDEGVKALEKVLNVD